MNSNAEKTVISYLSDFWPEVARRVSTGGISGVTGVPGTRVDIRSWTQDCRPSHLREWRQRLLDGMDEDDDYVALIIQQTGRSIERWETHMPLRQIGIPLYGDGQWVKMELGVAVPVLKHVLRNPWMPHLKQVAR